MNRQLAVVVFFWLWTSGMVAAAAEIPVPDRVPKPYLATEPWPGFLPRPGFQAEPLPMDALAQFSRWEAMRRAYTERGNRPVRESPVADLDEGISPAPTVAPSDPLYWESLEFRGAWLLALERARAGDGAGCEEVLTRTPARTLEGERLARQLLFAAAVERGDRQAADSLYYRLSWNDAGRTEARLRAWKALEDGRPAAARSALGMLPEPTPGERAVEALTAWQAGETGPELDWRTADGLAQDALALAAARERILADDLLSAEEALGAVSPETLPPGWREPYERLLRAVRPGAYGEREEDEAAYENAARAFQTGSDDEAERLLNQWLSQWPNSLLRAQAYLLRGHLRTAQGRLAEAEQDLLAAERLGAGNPELRDRAAVVRAFIVAQEGRPDQARSTIETVLRGNWGAVAEGELRFDQSRIARLSDREDRLEAILLQLEEGFTGEPWPQRARADIDPAAWKAPYRSLPSRPSRTFRIEAPTGGPWPRLMWGEDVLVTEARRLETESLDRRVPGVDVSPGESPPPVSAEPASRTPMAFVDLGVGAPASLILGGGVAGMAGGLQYRADAARTLAQQRNDLPDYRRADWEAGLGVSPGDVRAGLLVEGTARTDDDAPKLGLSPDVVDASWWGLRGDLSIYGQEQTGAAFSMAYANGEVDAGASGRWQTEQTWLSLGGSSWLSGSRWEGRYAAAFLHYEQAGFPKEGFWYHHLRLVRHQKDGWYVGVRGGLYMKRVLLLPVVGVERPVGGGWRLWAGSEPSLTLPSFRETFVTKGDWNVPDLTLPAERRYVDFRGGIKWAGKGERSFNLGSELYKVDQLRVWSRSGPFWKETAVDDATGLRASISGRLDTGALRLGAKAAAQSLRAEDRHVPYVPRYEMEFEIGYVLQGWRWTLGLEGVAGRDDESGNSFGDFLRLDLEAAYRWKTQALPLGFQNMEIAVGIDNLTDVDDRRWPGIPAYGFGVVAGVRALYGS